MNVEAVGLAHHGNGHHCPDCAGWVDAKRVADYLGRDREFIYRNSLRLGGRKLGEGPKAPWVFKLDPRRRRPRGDDRARHLRP